MQKLKVLDLFSGIGGFSLGLERTGGFETICFCEIDPFCQKVLRKHWPHVPIVSDINKLSYNAETQELIYDGEVIYVGPIHIITGGYPCQPFSVAGDQKGEEDDRHLWPAMFSIVKKSRANWVIGENVAGHINMGLDSVLADLESEAYTVQTFIIPACAVDAKHRRDRLWIVAHTGHRAGRDVRPFKKRHNTQRKRTTDTGASLRSSTKPRNVAHSSCKHLEKCVNDGRENIGGAHNKSTGPSENVSNTISKRGRSGNTTREHAKDVGQLRGSEGGYPGRMGEGDVKSSMGRVVNGLSRRMDEYSKTDPAISGITPRVTKDKSKIRAPRLKALGNAVYPEIPEIIGDAILQSLEGIK